MSIFSDVQARWLLDDIATVTTLSDSSGNGRTAITDSTTTDVGFNNVGLARKIGQGQGIYSQTVFSDTTNFTISSLYRLDLDSTWNTYLTAILGVTNGSASGSFIGVTTSNELCFYYYNGTSHIANGSGVFLNVGEWVHISLVKQGNEYRMYLNGELIYTVTLTHTIGLYFSTCYVNGSYNNDSKVQGTYDDIALWQRALSDTEIKRIYRYYFSLNKVLLKSNNKTYSLKSEEILHETKMTSNTAPAPFVVSASSQYNSTFPAWKAFNGTNIDQNDCWVTVNNTKTGWIQVNYGSPKKINHVYITSRNYTNFATVSPKDFNILGSYDGVKFEKISEIRNQTDWKQNEKRGFLLSDVGSYPIIRLEILDNNGATHTAIGDILFSYIENLTQLPSDSIDNFIEYGSSSIENFNLINGNKKYILQKNESENTDGLWVQEIDRKPLSIKFE